jgi:hypothetical protein
MPPTPGPAKVPKKISSWPIYRQILCNWQDRARAQSDGAAGGRRFHRLNIGSVTGDLATADDTVCRLPGITNLEVSEQLPRSVGDRDPRNGGWCTDRLWEICDIVNLLEAWEASTEN